MYGKLFNHFIETTSKKHNIEHNSEHNCSSKAVEDTCCISSLKSMQNKYLQIISKM